MFILNRLGMIEGVETMRAQEERMNQIANNLANVDTTGYKKENITFWEMLHRTEAKTMRVGKALKVLTGQEQGPAELTGNPLDVLIDGEGFFEVQTPQGVRYTRAGNFTTDSTGQLVTQDGWPVLGDGGSIVIEGGEVTIGHRGEVVVDGEQVNRFRIVTFADATALEKEGDTLFRLGEGGEGGVEAENFRIVQGSLEQSNVNTAIEMTEMIDLQRAFQAQQKVVQAIDEIDGQAVNRVGKLTA
ncbi:MAG: flagellar basal-body rod protein FlgF [Thermodesulfobacteriota bacterium]